MADKTIEKVVRFTLFYILFFLPLFLVGIISWYFLVDGILYYCSDKAPVLDFIPPFVHTGQFGPTGDYYIADAKIVWLVWFLHLGAIFVPPLF